jgi:hypothetical protein
MANRSFYYAAPQEYDDVVDHAPHATNIVPAGCTNRSAQPLPRQITCHTALANSLTKGRASRFRLRPWRSSWRIHAKRHQPSSHWGLVTCLVCRVRPRPYAGLVAHVVRLHAQPDAALLAATPICPAPTTLTGWRQFTLAGDEGQRPDESGLRSSPVRPAACRPFHIEGAYRTKSWQGKKMTQQPGARLAGDIDRLCRCFAWHTGHVDVN